MAKPIRVLGLRHHETVIDDLDLDEKATILGSHGEQLLATALMIAA